MPDKAETTPNRTILLPSSGDYERTVISIDEQIEKAGGIWAFMQDIRTKNRHSFDYDRFLYKSVEHVFMLLREPGMTILTDDGMTKARTILTGMVMGHAVNQNIFPPFVSNRVYDVVRVSRELYSPDTSTSDLRRELRTQPGQRRLYQMASTAGLNKLNDQTGERIRGWAGSAFDQHQVLLTLGVGLSLFMGYDHHIEIAKKRQNLASETVGIPEEPDPLA